MHWDIAIYKTLVEDRLDKIKEQTYGEQTYENCIRKLNLKQSIIMLWIK